MHFFCFAVVINDMMIHVAFTSTCIGLNSWKEFFVVGRYGYAADYLHKLYNFGTNYDPARVRNIQSLLYQLCKFCLYFHYNLNKIYFQLS